MRYMLRGMNRPWKTVGQLEELRAQYGHRATLNVAPYVTVSDGKSHTTIDACRFIDPVDAALRLRTLDCTATEALVVCSIIRDELIDLGKIDH